MYLKDGPLRRSSECINNNNIFIFFRQGTRQLHQCLSTMFSVPLLLRKNNNVTLFIPISGRKRDTREAV